MRYTGTLYRAHKPVWAEAALSGEGAEIAGGRFNPKGVPALYMCLAPETAVKEYSRGREPLQPYTMVSYEADISPVFDATQAENLTAYSMTPEGLAANWDERTTAGGKAPTHIFAERLIADGFASMKVQSFAPGAEAEELNMVFWEWEGMLSINDDAGLLNQLDRPGW